MALVGIEIGADSAKRGYDAMAAGMLLVLPATRFAACYKLESGAERTFDLGFARSSIEAQVVKGFTPGSEAAKAGVREGDAIAQAADLGKFRSDATMPMTLTLKRAAEHRESVRIDASLSSIGHQPINEEK